MKNKPKPNSRTLLFLMKITLIQVLITSVSIVFGYALDSKGQEVLNRKVTLYVENVKVKDVLTELEKRAGVSFTYRPRLLKKFKNVSLNATEAQLHDVLSKLFSESIRYEVIGKQIVLKETSFDIEEEVDVATTRRIPTFTVTGKVADDTGAPLPGVNIIEKGTTNGTTSDVDGKYTVVVADANSTLIFSFIGYTSQEIGVGGRNVIDLALQPDISTLQEVVVVGYGEQKKITVTGSVVAVAGTDLIKSPAVDLSNSLAGRLPGVSAVQASGEPGQDNSTIRIRGVGSLGGSNALIVIDGIPDRDGGFGRLSPQDIETMSVLKDASAAIYGARAANGVILITTKRGKTGTPKISYDFNQGWAQPTRIPKMANASEYAAIMNEFPVYGLPVNEWSAAWAGLQQNGTYTGTDGKSINAVYSPSDVQKYKDGSDPWGHPNTDWFGTAFKKWSPQSRHNLQLSGGTENVKYLASIGYVNQDAYYKNSATNYKQYNFRMNLDARVNKYINTSVGIMAREEVRNYPTQSAGSIFRMLMRGRPTDPEVWPNGLPGPDIENGQNPIVVTTNATGYEKNPTDYLQSNGKVEITNPWIEGLKLTLMGSADKSINRDKKWETPWYLYTWDKTTYEADGVTPSLTKALRSTFTDPRLTQYERTVFNTNTTALLNYDHTFSTDHTIGLMVGMTHEKFTGDAFQSYRRDYISSVVDQPFAGGTTQLITGGNDNRYTYNRTRIGYYGRVTYNYKEKYLAEFVWRRDGSSIFPPGHQFGFFPGVLVGWNISNESFLQNVSAINFLKIRASYGEMGNDQVYFRDASSNTFNLQEYAYLSAYSLGSYPINGQAVTTAYEPVVANPNFTWERAKNSNIGLDGTFFSGKIDLSLDYFYNKRDHILIPKQGSTPASSGITTLLPPVNGGRVDNKGFEFKLGYNNQVSGLKYSLGVNGGYAKNKVVNMDEIPGAPVYQLQTGKPFSAQTNVQASYLAYQYDGVFKNAEEIASNSIDYSAVTSALRPGDMKFKDVNGDGKITGDDQVRLDKTITPTFTFGATINLQYRNFDLSILFQGATGGLLRFGTESGDIGNYLKYSYDHRWTVDNPSGTDPRLASRGDTYYTGGNFGNNTYNYYNTNYIRLKNLEFGYTIPAAASSKVGITGLRIYVNTLNLITWDKFKIWDPESLSGSGQYYPQARVINTGFRLTF
jgi:TonB-linked SusC/RagA family outer membrane protein